MSATSEPLALASEFPAATREQWRQLVTEVLHTSGHRDSETDPELALSTRTYDGIVIKPLYTAQDALSLSHDGLPGHPPFVRAATTAGASATGWDVRQRHADPDPERTNQAIHADLQAGAMSLWLVLGDAGLAVDDLSRALDGVALDRAGITLDAGGETRAAAGALYALAEQQRVPLPSLRGSLGADPIGLRARTGATAEVDMLGELAQAAAPALALATVDASVYHEAGGSDADELAIATAVGVAYLRALTDTGTAVGTAFAALEFRYALGADQFAGIAKLRAARRLWDRVGELCGVAERVGQRQHAVTSTAMMTRRDPWANLLRTTIACFAAAVGGAAAITVLPFDDALGLPDDFSRRIARNTQAILHDESSLARVIDPAGGSWYVETLTDALAERAWEIFTTIEQAGGALAALDAGLIDELVRPARQARYHDIAHRRAAITGVSEFALPGEQPVIRRPAPPVAAGGPLPRLRYAQHYERLRDRSDQAAQRPAVFLAALGPPPAYRARVSFASNLMQAGGIEPVVGTGNPDEMVSEFRAAGTSVVCLCSSDKVYADSGQWVAKALREAGAGHVWIAGAPAEQAESSPDIDGYLFAGCDALAVLGTMLDQLGVAR